MGAAATTWQKYDPTSAFSPRPDEWCLWSLVIDGERNYFGGRLIVVEDKQFLFWDGFTTFPVDETVYFARVLPFEERA